MNWQEIASGVTQAFRNAGVKKDVIDLQEKQLGLLTDKIAMLEREKSDLMMQIANLQTKVANLELELDRFRPKTGGLDDMQIKFLQLLFHHGDLSIETVAQQLGAPEGIINYHRDALVELKMITQATIGARSIWNDTDIPATYAILPKGRAYLVENRLVSG